MSPGVTASLEGAPRAGVEVPLGAEGLDGDASTNTVASSAIVESSEDEHFAVGRRRNFWVNEGERDLLPVAAARKGLS